MAEDKTFSVGETPPGIIRDRAPELFPMEIAGDEAIEMVKIVNQGIDSCLEACFISDRGDSYKWVEHKLKDGRVFALKLHCKVSRESLPVLLRRLYESDNDELISLRTDILDTMDIEEV